MSASPAAFDLREQLQRHLGTTYVFERELQAGGSAKVFLAREIALDRRVVIKVLPPDVSRAVDHERFRREILFVARLQHPHLIPLLSAGSVRLDNGGELRWFSMPYVEGDSLRERILRGSLAHSDVMRLLRELASALNYAHTKGVVHRDIKPENVLLSEGVSMIADFGVAKAIHAAAALGADGEPVTMTGTTLGTPAYMAPEQILSAAVVDHTADLYAFGCVAYELLTGAPPLLRASLRSTLAAQVSDRPVPLRQHRPDLEPALADVLMRCLEKDPQQRLPSAGAIVQVLDELAKGAHRSGAFAAVAPAARASDMHETPRATPKSSTESRTVETPVHSRSRSTLPLLIVLVVSTLALAAAVLFFSRG